MNVKAKAHSRVFHTAPFFVGKSFRSGPVRMVHNVCASCTGVSLSRRGSCGSAGWVTVHPIVFPHTFLAGHPSQTSLLHIGPLRVYGCTALCTRISKPPATTVLVVGSGPPRNPQVPNLRMMVPCSVLCLDSGPSTGVSVCCCLKSVVAWTQTLHLYTQALSRTGYHTNINVLPN